MYQSWFVRLCWGSNQPPNLRSLKQVLFISHLTLMSFAGQLRALLCTASSLGCKFLQKDILKCIGQNQRRKSKADPTLALKACLPFIFPLTDKSHDHTLLHRVRVALLYDWMGNQKCLVTSCNNYHIAVGSFPSSSFEEESGTV